MRTPGRGLDDADGQDRGRGCAQMTSPKRAGKSLREKCVLASASDVETLVPWMKKLKIINETKRKLRLGEV